MQGSPGVLVWWLLLTLVSSPGVLCSSEARHRQPRFINNPFGLMGHEYCVSTEEVAGVHRVGQCYNEIECLAMGGTIAGYCSQAGNQQFSQGVCCVTVSSGSRGIVSSNSVNYFTNPAWPSSENGSLVSTHCIVPREGVCWIRLDLLTVELAQMSDNCVHDRMTVMGGKEPNGNICGERSGEVTLVEVTPGQDVKVVMSVQSSRWRWNIGVTQIPCKAVEEQASSTWAQGRSGRYVCGQKNESKRNAIGSLGEKPGPNTRKKEEHFEGLSKKTARKVFKQLKKLPTLTEEEKSRLKIYKPSFTQQELNYETADFKSVSSNARRLDWRTKGRILYGNETDVNEYPWQVSMWIDKSHFCGGTLISDQWIATAAHCIDLNYRRHFDRLTVSLGDHNVQVYDDVKNIFRKVKKIVRSPQYDKHYINGDMALLQLEEPVEFTENLRPACLPDTGATDDDYAFKTALITGWGYTEKTKIIKPRPLTSEILREAEVFILPKKLCVKYSPFPITDRMICTYKGPLGVETTCQGDSGGPLVVNMGENNHVLIGCTSFGVSTCEGPYPSMFTSITARKKFIDAAMVAAPMEYMMNYETPADTKLFPTVKPPSLLGIFK